ncbi:MAG TPA: DUF2141 domain-containing protein, partial [Chlorobaculum parvum]|nr:DUF2141 domain-containing protein [Chlorobaculum parvum]
MKKIAPLLLLISALSTPAGAEQTAATAGTIEICVSNIRSSNGTVGVALFNTKKGFPGKGEKAIEG